VSELSEARERLVAKLVSVVGEGPIPRLDEALTHPSYGHETRLPDNQRLEFLGDAVLGLCTSELLVASDPDADEGTLSRLRSAAVNATALAEWARKVDLGSALALGKGARAGAERDQTNVLADAVEAVVAAVYVARGLERTRTLVTEIVRDAIAVARETGARDPKGVLQERMQALGEGTPTYRVTASSGPAHAPRFAVEVVLGERVLGRGEGASKKQAERAAAEDALRTDSDAAAQPAS
jgi:ribonuclease-3